MKLKDLKQIIPTNFQWSQIDSITFCREVESICPKFGYHVALTGGNLYKDGTRKDLDILIYRIRQCESPELDNLILALAKMGCKDFEFYGFVTKFTYLGKLVDMFYPESEDGDYDPET